MSVYQPRPYQTNCTTALAEARKNGVKKGLVVMASGLGKTVTVILDLQQFLQEHPSARVLCLCHQESILLQSKAKFQKFFGEEYSYGMFTGNYKTAHPVSFLFATFQTMRDHREEFSLDAFDYIVVDEAHHTAAETYQPTADYFDPQFLLGLTATKDRMDGRDILDTYSQVLYQMDIYDGWAEGWLARVDYRIMLDDLNQEEFEKYVGPHATNEKVSLAQLNKTIFAPQRDEGIVASIREQTLDLDNPSIFIFCSSIGHANAMAHQFGGEAAVIHSGQSVGLNEAILSSFRSGEIHIIISVDMLNEGIDVPEADVVVFLRATESSTIFFQQLGRGLRISSEKRTVRVLDYVANIERIAMILEMEETAKQRIPARPTYSPSVNKPEPLVVNIPATKFKVERVDVERLAHLVSMVPRRHTWTQQEIDDLLEKYTRACLDVGHWITTPEIDSDNRFPSSRTMGGIFNGLVELRRLAIQKYGNIYDLSQLGDPAAWGQSDDDCLLKYLRCSEEAKHWLSYDEVDNCQSLPNSGTYRGRFGGVSNVRKLAQERYGAPRTFSAIDLRRHNLSDEEMLQVYYNASKEVRRWLTSTDLRKRKDLPSDAVYLKRFQSIATVRRLAVERYGEFMVCTTVGITDEQIARAYQNASAEAGHQLSYSEFIKRTSITAGLVRRAGGITAIRRAAIAQNNKD